MQYVMKNKYGKIYYNLNKKIWIKRVNIIHW